MSFTERIAHLRNYRQSLMAVLGGGATVIVPGHKWQWVIDLLDSRDKIACWKKKPGESPWNPNLYDWECEPNANALADLLSRIEGEETGGDPDRKTDVEIILSEIESALTDLRKALTGRDG